MPKGVLLERFAMISLYFNASDCNKRKSVLRQFLFFKIKWKNKIAELYLRCIVFAVVIYIDVRSVVNFFFF